MRLYGLRMWVEQSYKQVKDALGLEIVSNAFWGIVMLVVGALMLRRALGGRSSR